VSDFRVVNGDAPKPTTDHAATRLRQFALALFCLGAAGTEVELLLLGHTDSPPQFIPLVALGLGIIAAVAVAVRPGPRVLRGFQVLMAGFVLTGPVGLYLHYHGNVEFELEMYPSLGGLDLVWKALTGATPALAPGAMILLGLMGLASTYRHPALSRPTTAGESR